MQLTDSPLQRRKLPIFQRKSFSQQRRLQIQPSVALTDQTRDDREDVGETGDDHRVGVVKGDKGDEGGVVVVHVGSLIEKKREEGRVIRCVGWLD